jgi:serine/threonine protein kinase
VTDRADAGLRLLLLAFRRRLLDERALVAAYEACRARPGEPAEAVLQELGLLNAAQLEAMAAAVAADGDAGGRDGLAFAPGVPEALRGRLETDRDGIAPAATEMLAATEPAPPADGVAPRAGTGPVAERDRFERAAFHRGGGLGMVWRAKDRQLHREVALKEIRPDRADEPDYRAMFLREVEITGRLEHPGVVPVYACGEDEEGRLYYAMRFIEGRSLREAIDEFHAAGGRLSWHDERFRALLRRFLSACDPIAFAHAKGVIHRDIKPENILLGPFGETLVVDWGLAKCLGREAVSDADGPLDDSASPLELSGSGGPTLTRGRVVGTPQYMPPEQAARRTDEVLAWSDVYSLGATLYTLLVGRPPFRYREAERDRLLEDWERSRRPGLTPEEATRQRRLVEARWRESERGRLLADVQDGRFLRPSDVRVEVPPALEAICLKAMARRPADRYAGAAELAADLNRWLDDQPVAVHRDAPSVRLARWARRNRGKAAAAAAFLLMSVVGLGVAAVGLSLHNRQVEAERDRAENSLRMARETASALMEPLDDADFGLFHPVKAVTLLREALAAHQALLKGQPDHPVLRVGIADIERRMGNLGRSLGYYDREVPLAGGGADPLEPPARLYGAAEGRLRAVLAEPGADADAEARRILRRTLLDRGELEALVGHAETARDAYRGALAGGPATGPDPLAAEAHVGLGRLALQAGDAEAARAEADRAFARLGHAADAATDPPTGALPTAIDALALRAVALREADPAAAAAAGRTAVRLAATLEKAESSSARAQALLSRTIVELAPITAGGEGRDATLRNLSEALKRLRGLSLRNPFNWQYTLLLARVYLGRGAILLEGGPWTAPGAKAPTEPAQDVKFARENLLEKLPPDRAGHPSSRRLLAQAWALEGAVAVKAGRVADAREAFDRAIDGLAGVAAGEPGPGPDADRLAAWRAERARLGAGTPPP